MVRGLQPVAAPLPVPADVSVVIPTFGREALVNRAVRSVVEQDCPPAEIIVVDDGSPTPVVLDEDVRSRVRLIQLAENRGAAAARNAAVREASCGWIAFLDSDDVWLPGKLDVQLAFVHKAKLPSVDACCTGWLWRGSRPRGSVPAPAATPRSFARGCWFSPGSTLVVRRDAFATVGLFDERLRRLEDFDWFVRYGLAGGQLAVCPEPLAIITPGRRAGFEHVAKAADLIESKHIHNPDVHATLSGALHFELAAAAFHARLFGKLGYHMVKSLLELPRLSPHPTRLLRRSLALPQALPR